MPDTKRSENVELNGSIEWLEADGLGGFASGTVSGIRTRRYHALLLSAKQPPTERMVLVNGFDAWVEMPDASYALSSQRYAPDVIHPDGTRRITAFDDHLWPRWRFRLDDGTEIEQELFVRHGAPLAVVCWRVVKGKKRGRLVVRPLLSGRDYHALHHENPAFNFEPGQDREKLTWRPYPGVPGIIALTNGDYVHEPQWYRNFLYTEERNRGLDDTEDLASPGTISWDLHHGDANLILIAEGPDQELLRPGIGVDELIKSLKTEERRRRESFPSMLHRAADAYLVKRGEGLTIIAGYPWFTDWGRDTFIALRGLCLATGRLDEARQILLEWSNTVSEGMLPNRFPDHGDSPEFNSVDASLWYIVAMHDYFKAMETAHKRLAPADRRRLHEARESILSGYAHGTRYGIHVDKDGLLAAGLPGLQLTWMDAKIGDWVVTPRIGKPVEVQALWLNAVGLAASHSTRWADFFARGLNSFRARFWNPAGYLYDVVDVDHEQGKTDAAFRPNQIFAIGGLPLPLLEPPEARSVVDAVETRLWTPLGLRSLAPGEPGYAPRCEGSVLQRTQAYHQGTVWPWLTGPFVEAWVRVRGSSSDAKRQAREKFLKPLLQHLDDAGLGHITEVADADPPHTPRGCPFQAWSLGEILRLDQIVLAK
jgi:predicted glycogen debranching enzyme